MLIGRQDPLPGIFPQIHLPDKTVGRRYVCLRQQKGIFTIEDLHALNKTRSMSTMNALWRICAQP
jgi:serine/threonine-protein kinase